jgi:hypothetical protein
MHPKVTALLAKIRAAGGVLLIEEDLPDLIELEALCRAEEEADRADAAALLERPVRVGTGLLLYRLSWGAIEWLRECAHPWFSGTSSEEPALIYAMAHSMGHPDAFSGPMRADRAAALRRIRAFAASIRHPWPHVMASADLLLPRPEPASDHSPDAAAPEKATAKSDVSVLARLAARFHLPEDAFLFGMSFDRLGVYIQELLDMDRAEVAMIAAMSGLALPPSSSTRAAKAFQAVAAKSRAIRERAIARAAAKPSSRPGEVQA